MSTLVSTTMCGCGCAADPPRRSRAPPEQADRFGGRDEVVPLGHRQAHHPEAQEDRDGERQPDPDGGGNAGERQAQQEAHQEAQQQARDGRDELRGGEVLHARGSSQPAGTTVRYGRIAKPTTTHSTTQRRERAAVGRVREQALAERPERPVRRSRRARRRGFGCCGSRGGRAPGRCPGSAVSVASLVALAPRWRAIDRTRGRRAPGREATRRRGSRSRRRQPRVYMAGPAAPRAAPATASSEDPALSPAIRRRRAGGGARSRARSPRRAASRSRRSRPGHASQLARAGRPRRRPRSCGRTGRSRSDDASAIASGRSSAGSSTERPPGEVRVHVVRPEADPCPPAEDGDEERQPVGSRPLAVRRGVPPPPGATSAWTSTSSGRDPSSVGATTLPGAPSGVIAEKGAAGSGRLSATDLAHFEDADLLGRPEAVLDAAQQAQSG